MLDFSGLGRILLVIGLVIAGIGLFLIFMGDFFWHGKNVSFYFPLATSILVSLILSLILWFIHRR